MTYQSEPTNPSRPQDLEGLGFAAAEFRALKQYIQTTIQNLESTDSGLQNNIDSEASTRASADTTLQANIDAVLASFDSHSANTANPHAVTKSQVGLSEIPNAVSDIGSTNSSTVLHTSKGTHNAIKTYGLSTRFAQWNVGPTTSSTVTQWVHLCDVVHSAGRRWLITLVGGQGIGSGDPTISAMAQISLTGAATDGVNDTLLAHAFTFQSKLTEGANSDLIILDNGLIVGSPNGTKSGIWEVWVKAGFQSRYAATIMCTDENAFITYTGAYQDTEPTFPSGFKFSKTINKLFHSNMVDQITAQHIAPQIITDALVTPNSLTHLSIANSTIRANELRKQVFERDWIHDLYHGMSAGPNYGPINVSGNVLIYEPIGAIFTRSISGYQQKINLLFPISARYRIRVDLETESNSGSDNTVHLRIRNLTAGTTLVNNAYVYSTSGTSTYFVDIQTNLGTREEITFELDGDNTGGDQGLIRIVKLRVNAITHLPVLTVLFNQD